jgi:class 3 adenylate cyclase
MSIAGHRPTNLLYNHSISPSPGSIVSSEHVARRLAAILAADVAGSCRLIGIDEEGTLAQLKALRKTLFDPKITDHRGRIVKNTGDGALVEFYSLVDAVRCAVEIQRGMAEQNIDVPQVKRIEFRIGIHVGDIIVDDNDIFGDGVNIAARLEGIAEPGGVCISDDAQRQVRGKVDFAFEDMGPQNLKNIVEPMRVWRLRMNASGSAAAPIEPPVRVYALAPKTIAGLPSPLDGEDSNVAEPQAPRRGLALGVRGFGWSLALLVLVAVAGLGTWQAAERSGKATAKHSTDETPTVAVLSFDNLTGDPGQENFSDGLSEELITAISQFEPLRVLARNTTFA